MDPLVTDSSAAQQHRHLILLIEGDFLVRWRAGEYLRETGFEVIEAVDQTEGLAALRARSPIEAIFCDAEVLQGEAGQEFRRCLESEHPTLPVLLAVEQGVPSALKPEPRHARVTKPYVLEDIERRLRALIAVS